MVRRVLPAKNAKPCNSSDPYLAFEAEPRWVAHQDHYGNCQMVSQWATVLTITADPAVPKLDPNSRAAREAALRAELAEDRD